MEVSAGVRAGAHHEVDPLLINVCFLPVVPDLVPALIKLIAPAEHYIVRIRSSVVVVIVIAVVLDAIGWKRPIERAPHPRLPIASGNPGVTPSAEFCVHVPVCYWLGLIRARGLRLGIRVKKEPYGKQSESYVNAKHASDPSRLFPKG